MRLQMIALAKFIFAQPFFVVERDDDDAQHLRDDGGHIADDLPFWRRLLCAPEVPDVRRRNVLRAPRPEGEKDAAGRSPQNCAPAENSGGGETPQKSVFADPPHPCAANISGTVTARWAVTDTRRMCAATDDDDFGNGCVSSAPFAASDDTHSTRQQLKQARREQMMAEIQRRKKLERAEEALRQKEQSPRDVSSSSSSSPVFQRPPPPPQGSEASPQCNDAAEDVDECSSAASDRLSVDDTDDDGGFIDGDEKIDIKDLNCLHEYYKRREKATESVTGENSLVSSLSTTVFQNDVPRKRTRRFALQSRQYIERVVLAQRSQQLTALMWLLAESMRHACRLQQRLAQLYVNYVPAYLQVARDRGLDKDEQIISITRDSCYAYYSSDTFDYEHHMYKFSQAWEALFLDVLSYLSDDTSTPAGSVGFAATLLYSMELFERQRNLQLAVRQVEQWLKLCWERINAAAFLPHVSSADAADASSTSPSASTTTTSCDAAATIAAPGGTAEANVEGDAEGEAGGCDDGLAVTLPAHIVEATDDADLTYVPMEWWRAQDADVRAHVSWNRKKRKLHHMRFGAETLRRCAPAEGSYDPHERESSPLGDEEGGGRDKNPHRHVNVGCFGFSFFSLFD